MTRAGRVGRTERLIGQIAGREAARRTQQHLEAEGSGRLRALARLCDEAFDRATDMSRIAMASEIHESCRLAVALGKLDVPDVAPEIVVAGLPRSGTTALQRSLVASSGRASTTTGWHLAASRFEDLAAGLPADRARARREVDARYHAVTSLNPRLMELHPLGADCIEECTPIFRATARHSPWAFLSPSREVEAFLLDDFGHEEVHGPWLTAISTLPTQGHLVVKSSLHTGYLRSLRAMCPRARVLVSRAPAEAIVRSFAVMVHEARRPFADGPTIKASAAQALRVLHSMAEAFRLAIDGGVEIEIVDRGKAPRTTHHALLQEMGVRPEDVEGLANRAPELCS